MANPNNWKQNSEPKSEFTNYTVAGTDEGRAKAEALRADYELERIAIAAGRALKLMAKIYGPENLNPTTKRCGYPKKRERNEDIPSHRGVPHSGFLKRFKIIEREIRTAIGGVGYSAKVYVLHATRGWKLYA